MSLSPSSKFSKRACDVTKGPLTGLFHVIANTFKQPLGLKHLDLVLYLPNMSNKTFGPKHRAKAVASFTRWGETAPLEPKMINKDLDMLMIWNVQPFQLQGQRDGALCKFSAEAKRQTHFSYLQALPIHWFLRSDELFHVSTALGQWSPRLHFASVCFVFSLWVFYLFIFFYHPRSPPIISGLVQRDSNEAETPVPVLSEADDKWLQQRGASISGKRIKSSWRHLGSHPALHRTAAPVCLIRVDSRWSVWADRLLQPRQPRPALQSIDMLRGGRDGPGRWTAEVKSRVGSAAPVLASSDLFLVFRSRSVRRWPHYFFFFQKKKKKYSTKRLEPVFLDKPWAESLSWAPSFWSSASQEFGNNEI